MKVKDLLRVLAEHESDAEIMIRAFDSHNHLHIDKIEKYAPPAIQAGMDIKNIVSLILKDRRKN